MQIIGWLRSFLAGALSRLANKIATDKKQLAITYNVPEEKNNKDNKQKEEETLKVISCKVKNIKVKKKNED